MDNKNLEIIDHTDWDSVLGPTIYISDGCLGSIKDGVPYRESSWDITISDNEFEVEIKGYDENLSMRIDAEVLHSLLTKYLDQVKKNKENNPKKVDN